ncbi:MAG: hypothetical protein AAFQ87_10630 [Bacteroidota bacterium]
MTKFTHQQTFSITPGIVFFVVLIIFYLVSVGFIVALNSSQRLSEQSKLELLHSIGEIDLHLVEYRSAILDQALETDFVMQDKRREFDLPEEVFTSLN